MVYICFILGVIVGIVLMCILQINRLKEFKKYIEEKKSEAKFKEIAELKEKSKSMKLNELVDEYRKGKNIYTVMRDITNLIKGW